MSGKTKRFQFNVRRYFDIPRTESGDFRLSIQVLASGEWLQATAIFRIKKSRIQQSKKITGPYFETLRQLGNLGPEQAAHQIIHQAFVAQTAKGKNALFYDTEVPGFSGSMEIDSGADIKDFHIIPARREIRDEPLYYDYDLNIIKNPEQAGVHKGAKKKVAISGISWCDYTAILYLRGEDLYLWTIGRYGPIPMIQRLPAEDPGFLNVLCKPKKVASSVKSIVSVTDKAGVIHVSYRTVTKDEKNVPVNERGKITTKQ